MSIGDRAESLRSEGLEFSWVFESDSASMEITPKCDADGGRRNAILLWVFVSSFCAGIKS